MIFGGDGGEHEKLSTLARELGVADRVDFAGHYANPFAELAAADLFVLSSISEGMCNALIEALACGCPCLSTDCRSGAREILDDGRVGPLVPIGDDGALARAMAATLDAPPSGETLAGRAADFDVQAAAGAYARILLEAASGRPPGAGQAAGAALARAG